MKQVQSVVLPPWPMVCLGNGRAGIPSLPCRKSPTGPGGIAERLAVVEVDGEPAEHEGNGKADHETWDGAVSSHPSMKAKVVTMAERAAFARVCLEETVNEFAECRIDGRGTVAYSSRR